MIADLDRDLSGDVGAPEGPVRWEPAGGVRVTLLLVGASGDGEKVQGVVGEVRPYRHAELLGSRLPGVAESDNVVDLDLSTCSRAPREPDDGTGVGVVQNTALHHASVSSGLEHHVGEIATQDVVSSVAAIVPIRHIDIVAPGLSELLTAVARFRCPAFDAQGCQAGKC